MWLLNDRNLFLLVLEVGKFKIKALVDFVSVESMLPGLQMAVFVVVVVLSHGRSQGAL